MSEEQLTVLRAMTWGFRCPALILLAPLSFLRALLLSYLAFPLLSPHNLFCLLSPTVTPFLVIVSIPLFVLSLCGGPGAPQCWESLPALHPGPCKVCTAGLALCVCFAGPSTSYQVAEQHRIWPYMQIRSSHVARSIWEHFRLKREKKKEDKSGKEEDSAVKNTSIGSSRKPL